MYEGDFTMSKRFEELDSLRGLAALSVFFSHIYMVFNTDSLKLLFEYGPFRPLIAGSEAVVLFFVLSGFVLSLPFYSKNEFSYPGFLIKRICRIYLPYIFMIVLAIVCRELFYNGKIDGISDSFNVFWSNEITVKDTINHILLIGNYSENLNPVVWSLVHEMRISIIFPVLMFLIVRMRSYQSILLAVSLSLISVGYEYITKAPFGQSNWYATIHYCFAFIIGALIAKYRTYLISFFKGIKPFIRVCVLITGIILFDWAHPSFAINIVYNGFNPYYRTVIDSWFTAIGASIIIIYALSSDGFSKFLRQNFINHLGKISYSLYLMHVVLLITLLQLLHNYFPVFAICFIVIIIAYFVSSLLYRLVETNSIKLGKYLSQIVSSQTVKVEDKADIKIQ
jgi:peptidoglycan/LPS O-acetylase OafA/YrhL